MLLGVEVYLKGACQRAMMAATASLTTRLPCSLLPLPLSVMMARRPGRLEGSFTVTRYLNLISQQKRLSMATPAVIACRLISARAGGLVSSQRCCTKWPSEKETLKRASACSGESVSQAHDIQGIFRAFAHSWWPIVPFQAAKSCLLELLGNTPV